MSYVNNKDADQPGCCLRIHAVWSCSLPGFCRWAGLFRVWSESPQDRFSHDVSQLSSLVTKPTKWHVCPAKTQISLGICPVWSESSLSAWRKLRSLATHSAHSEDSDQTGRMPRLIWVFAERTCHFVGFLMMFLNYLLLLGAKCPSNTGFPLTWLNSLLLPGRFEEVMWSCLVWLYITFI